MTKLTRRELIAGAAGTVLLQACSRQPVAQVVNPNVQKPLVAVVRAAAYTQDVYDTVRRILTDQKLNVKGKRVVLKPNLVEFDRNTAINTHPMLVHAALEGFRSLGAADVRIAEGPGHRRNTLDLADAAGYYDTIPQFEELFTDLNLDEVSKIRLRKPFSKLKEIYLPNTILGADLIVSMPKMKTHHWVGATLSMKNFFGIVPGGVYGWPKNVLHWSGIHQCIVDLSRVPGRTFAIADGIVGMEGNGPIQGTPKKSGVIVAGRVLDAVDATCARVMGIDPNQVAYLNAPDCPHYNDEGTITQTGERPATVRTNFQLIKEFSGIRLA
ncbi:MAG TPA: DUF362 domain-containing protein [Bryobacteraceae bacterium]|jgi:uncharacterized protein (DUF362 family)